jgi:hypothetical protein
MKKSKHFALGLLILVHAFSSVNVRVLAGTDGNKGEVIRQARQSYYSLSRIGLLEFQANIQPNWQVALQDQLAANPAAAQEGLKLLNGLHFSVSMNPQGNVKIDHTSDFPAPNEQTAAGFNQIYAGVEKTVSGFFKTWNLFMLDSPFPEVNSEYQVQDLGGQYLLTYKESTAQISTTMTKEFAITEISVSLPHFKSVIKPHFTRTQKGYVLTGYEANYEPATDQGKAELKVQLDYQEVSGLQLPRKLNIDTVNAGTSSQVELLFNDYKVKNR